MPEPDDYCPRCMMTGRLLTSDCPDCGGTGHLGLVPPDAEPMVTVAGKFGEPPSRIPKRDTET